MKSLWKTILDGLTYQDLAGHRQFRAYTVITSIILFQILITGGMALINRYLVMSKVQADPVSIEITAEATQQTTVEPVKGTPVGCPTDSERWSLTSPYASENYNVIQPGCVYEGLENTIAWTLAVREGYSRAEATQQLGFAEMPMRKLDQVTIPAAAQGLAEVPVSFIPPNPDFTEWRLNDSGAPAVTYALRGCFRTSTIVGNRLEVWGGDYPVICLVIEDAENTQIVYSMNGHIYTTTATPMRSFLLFGYLEDGLWAWLGTQEDPKHEITDPEAYARERLTIATMYDSRPWDAEWLKTFYRLRMQPLPENWQSMTDENEKQAILNALSAEQSGATP